MADFSSSQPHSAQGSGQLTFSKMPGTLPNGAPPQWGQQQDVNVKPISTSQFPSMHATNGTRGSLHHSHPGSLSSHSSRDSSPGPSRLGGPAPHGIWPQAMQNHTDSAFNHNSVPSGSPAAPPTQPIGSFPNSSANQPPAMGQRMPPLGQVPRPGPMAPPPGPAGPQAPAPGSDSGVFSAMTRPTAAPLGAVSTTSMKSLPSQQLVSNNTAPGFPTVSQPQGSQLPPSPYTLSSSSMPAQHFSGPPQSFQQSRPFRPTQVPSGSVVSGQVHPGPPSSGQGAPRQAFPGQMLPSQPPMPSSQPQMSPSQPPMPSSQPQMHPSQHQMPPGQPQMPPSQPQMPPSQPQMHPSQHQIPPSQPQMHPSQHQMPPSQPQMHPSQPQMPPSQHQMPPSQYQMPPSQPQMHPSQPQMPPSQPQMPHGQRAPFLGQQQSSLSSRPPLPGQFPPSQGQIPNNNVPPSLNSMPTAMGPPPSSMGPPTTSMGNYSQLNPMLSGPRPLPPMNQTGASSQSVPRPAPGQYMPGHPPQHLNTADPGLNMNKRYPQQPSYQLGAESLTQPMNNLSVTHQGYNRLWGQEHHDLLQSRNILPPQRIEAPKIKPVCDFNPDVNCSPDIFRCTLTKIPETDSLLKKSRLPLGVLIHPFRDLNNLPVIQCSTIVRCRTCRTYINPFVYFMDEKHWKCNLCYRPNELPNEFHFDPVTKTYGEPTRRPEIRSATIEFIAPSEYMLRPPQPAVYLFLLDVSRLAVESGYLHLVCETLLNELDRMPGDSRTAVGFITFDSSIHFYSLAEGLSAPQQMVVMDIDDVFLPCPENLLANLAERQDLVRDLLTLLPTKFAESYDTGSALGAALQAAFKLMSPTGGRVTVFQCCLPNKGPGALKAREDPANRASKDVPHLNPATDFYKQLALEFSGQQIAVDLFLLNQQYSDLASIGGVSKFSGGCIHHFPLFQTSNIQSADSLEHAFRRYLTRKIGFEAVMRIRCSRGLSIHTFHGNFFVRSTDLLSLPNVNPDAGFGMQVSIEENLCDMQAVCFQAALLYTSSKGERRIRVHTLCLPIASSLPDILHSADQQCIIGLLSKMAVDRSYQYSVSDARDAFVNVVIDALSAYKLTQSSGSGSALLSPHSLRLLPLYILALLKNVAFRSGTLTRLDDRLFAMNQMKSLPLANIIQFIYPDLYPIHSLDQFEEVTIEEASIHMPPRLHLSAEKVDSHGAFLMDVGDQIFILICRSISPHFCENVLGVSSFNAIPEDMFELPELDCEDSRRIRAFVSYLQSEKPYCATLHIIREDSKHRHKFFERLIEDRTESSLSYYEFLQHIKSQVK